MRQLILTATLIFTTLFLSAQPGEVTLKIGDKAPELNLVWIKGEPVEKFDSERLYLVEFWATWCRPCVNAMPHLSQLAREHKDKLTVIGVNVWEKNKEGVKYEENRAVVEKFVDSMGDKIDYLVAMDNNDLYMANEWMLAAGQRGIPASFLIKEGVIIWIGHPMRLDAVLEQVFDGTYDMGKTSEEINKESKKMAVLMAEFKEFAEGCDKALAQDDY